MKLFILMALCLISLAVPSMADPWYGKEKRRRIGWGGVTLGAPDIVFRIGGGDSSNADNNMPNGPFEMNEYI
ncbi:uncharacterized protein LOC117568767 isoform X6 [Drosophila albomicans]|uniref:Uncharacterized protein LOC117568767 isoform X5 n=1 Tax=Drosophila albomicans TaxID=7291 RepID=A0A6P8X192_DROAB|nr:uncharacterized protein LOC117568767 isoform X5 [Drosophila albomicans]XP_034105499.1 uncharacterized protein LOC117568767 isoform X6 [Drosophila albomicans]